MYANAICIAMCRELGIKAQTDTAIEVRVRVAKSHVK